MASWSSGMVESDGVKLFYTRTGGDAPPVLLVHGFADDGRSWTPIARVLERDYDLIMVDGRGHGRSECPRRPFSTSREMAADLAAVISVLGLRRPVVLGHSMGAVTTLAFAATYPHLARAILLEDPPSWWAMEPSEQAESGWHEQSQRWLDGLKSQTLEQVVAQQRGVAPRWSEEELRHWSEAKLRFNLDLRLLHSGRPPGWPDALKNIACPALLITGEPEQGALVHPAHVAPLAAMLPQLQVVQITGAGHNIRREQPARFIEVVRDFISSVVSNPRATLV